MIWGDWGEVPAGTTSTERFANHMRDTYIKGVWNPGLADRLAQKAMAEMKYGRCSGRCLYPCTNGGPIGRGYPMVDCGLPCVRRRRHEGTGSGEDFDPAHVCAQCLYGRHRNVKPWLRGGGANLYVHLHDTPDEAAGPGPMPPPLPALLAPGDSAGRQETQTEEERDEEEVQTPMVEQSTIPPPPTRPPPPLPPVGAMKPWKRHTLWQKSRDRLRFLPEMTRVEEEQEEDSDGEAEERDACIVEPSGIVEEDHEQVHHLALLEQHRTQDADLPPAEGTLEGPADDSEDPSSPWDDRMWM